MKSCKITFLDHNKEPIHSFMRSINVAHLENRSLGKLCKGPEGYPNDGRVSLVSKKDAGMLESVTSTVTDYLGLTTKSHYDLNLSLPSCLVGMKQIFLEDYVDLILTATEEKKLEEIQKRMNWSEVYAIFRLASTFDNLGFCRALCRFSSISETWQNQMLLALVHIVIAREEPTASKNEATLHQIAFHIQKATTLLMEQEPLNAETILEMDSLAQVFLNISREEVQYTSEDIRGLALQAWYKLSEKLLIPWSPKIFSVLEDLATAPRISDTNTYIFDKYRVSTKDTGRPTTKNTMKLEDRFLATISKRLTPTNSNSKTPSTLADFLEDLPWESSSIFLAGGSVVDSLAEIMGDAGLGAKLVAGDMDLFIIGENLEKKKAIMVQTLKMIEKHFSQEHDIFYGVGGGVLTVWFANCLTPFSIQIIMGLEKGPKELLDRFDLSCCEALWNGKKILSTRRFVDAMASNEGLACHATLKRVLKYNNKGWSIRCDENPNTKLLYNRYTTMPLKEIEEVVKEMKYACGYLPNSNGLQSVVDANMYELKKRFRGLTRDFLALSKGEAIYGPICQYIRDFTTYTKIDDLTDVERDEKERKERKDRYKQLNVGAFEEISWNTSQSVKDNSYGLKIWYPKMERKSISFRIDAKGCKRDDLHSKGTNSIAFIAADPSTKYGDPESQMRVSCDQITRTTFLNIVNELFNNFLKQKGSSDAASVKPWKRGGPIEQKPNETMADMARNMTKTTWPKKLLETGFLSLKERKWENAELFYKGPGLKKERLGLVGDKFVLGQPDNRRAKGGYGIESTESVATENKVELFSDLSNYNVSLDLNLKVVLMIDEYIPCISVNSITLYDS